MITWFFFFIQSTEYNDFLILNQHCIKKSTLCFWNKCCLVMIYCISYWNSFANILLRIFYIYVCQWTWPVFFFSCAVTFVVWYQDYDGFTRSWRIYLLFLFSGKGYITLVLFLSYGFGRILWWNLIGLEVSLYNDSWEIDGDTGELVSDFIFWGSKITADSDCSHEIKRRFTPWKESYDQPR